MDLHLISECYSHFFSATKEDSQLLYSLSGNADRIPLPGDGWMRVRYFAEGRATFWEAAVAYRLTFLIVAPLLFLSTELFWLIARGQKTN